MEGGSKDERQLNVRIVRVAGGRSVAVADRQQCLLRNCQHVNVAELHRFQRGQVDEALVQVGDVLAGSRRVLHLHPRRDIGRLILCRGPCQCSVALFQPQFNESGLVGGGVHVQDAGAVVGQGQLGTVDTIRSHCDHAHLERGNLKKKSIAIELLLTPWGPLDSTSRSSRCSCCPALSRLILRQTRSSTRWTRATRWVAPRLWRPWTHVDRIKCSAKSRTKKESIFLTFRERREKKLFWPEKWPTTCESRGLILRGQCFVLFCRSDSSCVCVLYLVGGLCGDGEGRFAADCTTGSFVSAG